MYTPSPEHLLQQHRAAQRAPNPGFRPLAMPANPAAFWEVLETHHWNADHDVAAISQTGFTFLSFVLFYCPQRMHEALALHQQHRDAAQIIKRPDPHGHHQGWAPLHWAARLFQGQPWVPTLLALGADATATCSDAHTAPEASPQALGLLMLCFNPRMQQFYQPDLEASTAAAQALISAGADVGYVNEEGAIPLHGAAQHAAHLVPLLLAHPNASALINTIDAYAQTPLTRALISQPSVVMQLIQAGADPWLSLPRKDGIYKNAVDVARLLLQGKIGTPPMDRDQARQVWEVFTEHAHSLRSLLAGHRGAPGIDSKT